METVCERTGLTSDEVKTVVRCLNGVSHGSIALPEEQISGFVLNTKYLHSIIFAEFQLVMADQGKFSDCIKDPHVSADLGHQIGDLAEKVAKLSDQQSEYLIAYSEGWRGAQRFLSG